MTNFYTHATRLVAAAKSLTTLYLASALFVLAEHYGEVGEGEREDFEEVRRARLACGIERYPLGQPLEVERFRGTLRWMAGDHGRLLELARALPSAGTLECRELLELARPLVTTDLVFEMKVIGDALLVVYLLALRKRAESSMGRDERELFSRTFSVDEEWALELVAAADRIWLSGLCDFGAALDSGGESAAAS